MNSLDFHSKKKQKKLHKDRSAFGFLRCRSSKLDIVSLKCLFDVTVRSFRVLADLVNKISKCASFIDLGDEIASFL